MTLNSGNIFKSFAEQKNFSFNSVVSFGNTSGISNLSLSGDGGRFSLLSFKTGRIYDPINRFVKCYSSNEDIDISGNFSSGSLGYFINGSPVSLNTNVCSSSLSFDNFVFSTTGTSMDCSLNMFGESNPSYELSFNNQTPLTGSNITGFLRNTSTESFKSFKIFDASSFFSNYNYGISSNMSGVKIKPNNSGQIVLNYSGNSSFNLDNKKQVAPLSGNLSFVTNFGNISVPSIVPFSTTPFYSLDFQLDSSGVNSNTGSYWSFQLARQACSGTRFQFSLESVRFVDPYYSFSNSLFIRTGYNNNGFISSLVPYRSLTASYIGTGFISGAGCSGDDTFITRFEIVHSHPSGLYSNRFKYSVSGIEDSFLFTGILSENL